MAEISKITYIKDWDEELKCFKNRDDEKVAELNKLVSTLNKGLRNRKLVNKISDDQRMWEITAWVYVYTGRVGGGGRYKTHCTNLG